MIINDVQIYNDFKAADYDLTNGHFDDAGELYGQIGASVEFGKTLMDLGILQA